MSDSPQPIDREWLGNLEAGLAVLCVLAAFLTPAVSPPRLEHFCWWIGIWALGIGCGLGGLRFGATWARWAGGLSAGMLTLLLLFAVGTKLATGNLSFP